MGGFYEILDLNICSCQLMLASTGDFDLSRFHTLRVASKFTRSAEQWLDAKGIQGTLIKLHGAMELAVKSGLADAIIDLVDTGSTLKANDLVAYDSIADISARLIVNHVDYKYGYDSLAQFITELETTRTDRPSIQSE